MTKTVRIENACNSSYKVKVLVQEQKYDTTTFQPIDEWVTVKEIDLDYPTIMATEMITTSRRILIVENGAR